MAEGRQQKLTLPILTKELKDVRAKWFQLGVNLKLRHPSLKDIEADHGRRGVEHCMTEMLELWLRDSGASWDQLATALSDMDRRALAERLRVTYIVPSLTRGNVHQPLPGVDHFLNPAAKSKRQSTSVAQYFDVHRENQNLQKEYMQFLLSVGDLLEQRKVSTNNLLFAWSIRTDNTIPPSSLCEASSVRSFFQALALQYSKYFDYHVIADLAEQFGREEGVQLVKSYENTLKDQLGPRIKRKIVTRASKLVVKVDWKASPNRSNQDFAVSFRTTLSKLFRHRPEEYVLKSVRDGCLELTYLVPDAGIPHFRDIVCKNTDCLKQLCVMTLTVNEEILWAREQPERSHQAELENFPSPSKKQKMELGTQVHMPSFERGTASMKPSRVTDQRRHNPAQFRGQTRGITGNPYDVIPYSTYRELFSKWIPASCGLVAIIVGVVLLVIAGVKRNSSSSMTLLLGSCLFLVVGFISCSLVLRCTQHKFFRLLRYSLLVVIVFVMVLYWHYQREML